MNLVNKPPYMGFNCINTLLFATTLLCQQASQKISLKCNTLNLFQAFATLKKEVKQDKCFGQSTDSFCDIFLQE